MLKLHQAINPTNLTDMTQKILNANSSSAIALRIAILMVMLVPLKMLNAAQPGIDSIGIVVSPANLDQFGTALSLETIEQQVGTNLSEWQFPVKQGSNALSTHTLEVDIGALQHSKTPVGFSFSSGNSDPRAIDFQKSDVIEVSCRLVNNPAHQLIRVHSMSFSANGLLNAKQQADSNKIKSDLADHISTTCYEVLDGLNISKPVPTPTKFTHTPAWMPSVRIETQETPAQPPVSQSTPAEPEKDSPVKIEQQTTKQITIHNQGSPLILKFGHDRL